MFPLDFDDIGSLHATALQLYLGCRWSTLLAVIFQLVGFDKPGKLNCEVRSSDPLAMMGKGD
jgi:hypothetical protein